MKIGSNIFENDFIYFSISKETKYGYTPASGLVGGLSNCVLTECDPDEPARSNCERICFSDSKMCECRCPGMCYDNFCECGDSALASGDYQQYSSIPTAYNFGDPKRVCPAPDQSFFVSMEEGSTDSSADCSCRKCPETGKPAPDPNAPRDECCKDSLESYGACTCKQDVCDFVDIFEGRRIAKRRIRGETTPYMWVPDPDNTGCYKCMCPEPMAPEGKKFWRCPEDGEEECQETFEEQGTYASQAECQQKLQEGLCQKKFVGLWNGNDYVCREKPDNFPTIGVSITEYDTQEDCNNAVVSNTGSCGAQRRGSSVYTGLGHCDYKWNCDSSGALFPGDPWVCNKNPFFMTASSGVYDSDAICRQNCCYAQYDESFGRCSYDLDTVIPGWGCVIESKRDCLSRPGGTFSCGDCDTIPEGRECVGGTPTCEEGQNLAYEVYPTGLFTSELRCRCVNGP